nr:MAG TPA: ethylene-responsive transcription factor [Caudoviricetes sp.]
MQEGRERKKVNGVEIGMFIGRNNANNTSGYKGVSRHGHGWRAKITVCGKTYRTPVFDTLEEAHMARLKLEDELLPNN